MPLLSAPPTLRSASLPKRAAASAVVGALCGVGSRVANEYAHHALLFYGSYVAVFACGAMLVGRTTRVAAVGACGGVAFLIASVAGFYGTQHFGPGASDGVWAPPRLMLFWLLVALPVGAAAGVLGWVAARAGKAGALAAALPVAALLTEAVFTVRESASSATIEVAVAFAVFAFASRSPHTRRRVVGAVIVAVPVAAGLAVLLLLVVRRGA